jgi:dTDP-4-dehydrorhamnose reductase
MKILLLGKNGQVGWELQRALAPLGQVIALDRSGVNGLSGDLANLSEIEKTILAVKPDVIVNAAAYTAVDKAEGEPEQAHLINAKAPALLARLCKQINARLVHYSTDYVFDGTGHASWSENQPTAPLNVYGATKAAGEQTIQESGCRYLIFRTSWVFASKGNNFAKTMLRLASERSSLNVIADQIGVPTGADLIADITAQAIASEMAESDKSGIYHLAASGETSWYEYARYVIDVAREMGRELQVSQINPIPSSEYPTPAQRPLNSRLNCDKLRSTFGLNLPHWKLGINRMLQEI